MDPISELRKILGGFLNWNKCRLDCFSGMLVALFSAGTVNLKRMALFFPGEAAITSKYHRMKRFFRGFTIDQAVIARWVFMLFFSPGQKIYLTIDRTNWFFGKAKINILLIGIAYEGLAIPVFWTLLNKAGNASAKEHITILQRAITTLGHPPIAGVLGDREFASGTLFGWLNKRFIPFYIRIKDNSSVKIRDRTLCPAKKVFNDLKPRQAKIYSMTVWMYGEKIYLAGSRSERGELMVVATNQKPNNAIAIYLRRWEIESLFQGLKSRGFHLEDTHLTKAERLEKLIALLAVGFAWAHKVGEWHAVQKPIVFNQYRDSRRPQYSYFRYGFDLICQVICNIYYKTKQFKECLKQIVLPDKLLREIFI